MKALSREQVREVDRCAIETVGVPGVVLMENAGRNASDEIERYMSGAPNRRVALICGAGNNGGDGYVVARHLFNRGATVAVFLIAPEEKISGDAATNLHIIRRLGLTIHTRDDFALSELSSRLEQGKFDLLVDAIGGTGISGPLRGDVAEAVEQLNAAAAGASVPVAAVDIPTGLDCDTGTAEGPVVRADRTITFVARKKGFDWISSSEFTGDVYVVDIGINPEKLPCE